MKKALLALALGTATACGSNSTADNSDYPADGKDVLMHNDFDSLVGWIPDASTLSKEKAHSGQYSLKVDKGQAFSLGYSSLLGQLSNTRIRGVRLDAWAYLPDKDARARLGFIVKDPVDGKELLGEGLDLQEQVRNYGEWTKISKEFALPAAANYSSQLVVFLWGPDLQVPVYLDDIILTALR